MEERQEIFVARPGAVEKNVVAERPHGFQDFFRVEEKAIVSGKLQTSETEGTSSLRGARRNLRGSSAKAGRVQGAVCESADDALAISFGL